ncbi:MAG: sulfatase-like hydrolase/transferase [Planctomycetota bacterium]
MAAPPRPDAPGASFASNLARFGCLLGLLLLAGCERRESQTAASAVLITLDTTIPQSLDMYGQDRGITPNLMEFSKECVAYRRARAVSPITLVSHASMLTGLYPPRHGIRDNGHLPLPGAAETLAERASGAGFQTAAFVSAVVLAAPFGLDQGFDVYDEPRGSRAAFVGGVAERGREEVTAAAIGWLDRKKEGQPFFIWVHYFDPHYPYEPPPEFQEQAGGSLYLGEVAAVDAALGELLARLRSEPGYDRMTIAVVGDHGEGLGRHGEQYHSLLAYDSTLLVPLLIKHPLGRGAGKWIPNAVSVVDIFPTLLDGMGLGAAPDVDGLDLLAGDLPQGRGVYFESYFGYLRFGWSPLAGWADNRTKYLHGRTPELFDLKADPGENKNIHSADDPRTRTARRAIEQIAARPALTRDALESQTPAGGADLSHLGYLGATGNETGLPHPLADVDLPAPRESLGEYTAIMAALRAIDEGDPSAAIAGLRVITEQNPRNVYAHELLGKMLIETGQPRLALVPLQAILDRGQDRATLRQSLASACASLGRFREALDHLDHADEMCPGEEATLRLRARIKKEMEEGGK